MSNIWVVSPYGTRQNQDKLVYKIKSKSFKEVWKYDLKNNVIAVGSLSMRTPKGIYRNPEGKTQEELERIARDNHPELGPRAVKDRAKVLYTFYHEVKPGDFIIAKKGKQKVLAIGKVFSRDGKAVYFSVKQGLERTSNKYNPHPNFINVKWKEDVLDFGENVFLRDRFGLLNKIMVNDYYTKYGIILEERISELWGVDVISSFGLGKGYSTKTVYPPNTNKVSIKVNLNNAPDWIVSLAEKIQILRHDPYHKERAHESLVEEFYKNLGYDSFTDIKYRQGRIDISIVQEGKIKIVNEVKKDWSLTINNKNTLRQAYHYALECGARFVVITNGDYYGVFDRKKGDDYKTQFIGEFRISKFKKEDNKIIGRIKK